MKIRRLSNASPTRSGGVAPAACPRSSGFLSLKPSLSPTKTRVLLAAAALALSASAGCSAKSSKTQKLESQGLAGAKEGVPEGKSGEPTSGKPELEPELPGLEGEHFSVFNLLDNRPLAHRIGFADSSPSLVVDATTPDFDRYIHGNHTRDWMLGQRLDDRGAAAIKGRTATIWLPSFRSEDDQSLRLAVYNPAQWDNKLSIKLNGSALEPVSLDKGWQEVSVEVPASSNIRADNAVELTFSNMGRVAGNLSGGALAWVQLGGEIAGGEPTAEVDKTQAAKESEEAQEEGAREDDESAESVAQAGSKAADDGAKAAEEALDEEESASPSLAAQATERTSELSLKQDKLNLERDAGLAWYVWLPDEAKLSLDLRAEEGCGVHVGLFVEDSEQKSGVTRATEVTRDLVLGRGEQQKTAVDLSEWAGQIARLELRPSDSCEEGQSVEIQQAELVVPGAKPELPEGVKPPKRIVFWVIDTLRADHLPLGFDTDVQAPNLVKLAEEGAQFNLAFVQGNESRTSHAAFFTGQYPNKNGLVGKGVLNSGHYLISEAIQDNGYFTGAHVANGYVSPTGGFKQGWNHFVNNLREGWGIKGADVARHGLDWIKKNRDKSLFLYLGTIDPHVTYYNHPGITELYDTEPYNGPYTRYLSGEELGKIKGGKAVSERDKLRIKNLYKGEVTYSDKVFGDFREQLEEEGLWEDTMIVISSDHGEEFWEHGSVGHGHNIYQELVHVPLIVYYPPLIPKNTVVNAGVDSIDIFPTVVDAAGGDRPDGLQGKSLIPLIHGLHGSYPEPAIATQYMIHYTMQMEQWKLYLRRGSYELYDRKDDPMELKDVAEKHPLASRWLLDSMGYFRTHRKEWDKEVWGAASNLKPGFFERIDAE